MTLSLGPLGGIRLSGSELPAKTFKTVFGVITSIDFEKKGDFLAVGDKGGRVVVFERKNEVDKPKKVHSRQELEELDYPLNTHPEFEYKTEFRVMSQSLKIEEKINKVRWCTTPNGPMHILSTNDRTIKLWKIKDQKLKKVKEKDPNPRASAENVFLAADNFESGHH